MKHPSQETASVHGEMAKLLEMMEDYIQTPSYNENLLRGGLFSKIRTDLTMAEESLKTTLRKLQNEIPSRWIKNTLKLSKMPKKEL